MRVVKPVEVLEDDDFELRRLEEVDDLVEVLVASTRLVIAVGDPQPGDRNDTIVYRTSGIDQKPAGRPVMADGA
ncbi:hypothetical protein CA850_10335 [Micromonospora echinospora]|uniref:Uncharacterized protein n=1 Tax=Micromonospora echinospora TaxID=1877 RepID=A0A1C4ZJ84_MICEC|nr:hypothetical protein CA850_10335 [Micromonospora echinospora]SCF33117.1 hypothetical protein GA0070618_5356 [Micromonospora echinospora]